MAEVFRHLLILTRGCTRGATGSYIRLPNDRTYELVYPVVFLLKQHPTDQELLEQIVTDFSLRAVRFDDSVSPGARTPTDDG